MKKVFQSFILSLAALAFAACNNSNTNKPDEPASNPLIGMWVVDTEDGNMVESYVEFGKDGVVTKYNLECPTFAKYEGGMIVIKEGAKKEEQFAMKYTFDEPTQAIWFSDVKVGEIENLSSDKFVLPKSHDYINSGTYSRANGIKTVATAPIPNQTSLTYMDGGKPQYDSNKGTINGIKYDNKKKKCWEYTKMVYADGTHGYRGWFGIRYYIYGTEYEFITSSEEDMYAYAQQGLNAWYKYTEASAQDEASCQKLQEEQ